MRGVPGQAVLEARARSVEQSIRRALLARCLSRALAVVLDDEPLAGDRLKLVIRDVGLAFVKLSQIDIDGSGGAAGAELAAELRQAVTDGEVAP